MKRLLEIIPERPVFFDLRQQVRKMSMSRSGNAAVATWIVAIVIFAAIAYSMISAARYVPLSAPMFILPVISGLLLPGVLSGLIAGEYQKRSLESLLAAPISSFQIVMAKALRGAFSGLAALAAAFLLIAMVGTVKMFTGSEQYDEFRPAWIGILLGIGVHIVITFAVTGLTLGISSMAKNTVSAILTTYGVMIGLFAVLPAIIFPIFAGPDSRGEIFGGHPIGMMTYALMNYGSMDDVHRPLLVVSAWSGVFVHLLLGGIGIKVAVENLDRVRRQGMSH